VAVSPVGLRSSLRIQRAEVLERLRPGEEAQADIARTVSKAT